MSYEARIDLPGDIRDRSVALLQATLCDALDLKARISEAHWHVKGWQALPLHALFDGLRGEVDGVVSLIVARIAALGRAADGAAMAAGALYQYPPQVRSGEVHLTALATRFARFGKRVRDDSDAAAELGDAVTADVLARIARETDRQLRVLAAR